MSTKINYVGVDDGHSAVKIVKEDGTCFLMSSRAQYGKTVASLADDGENDAFVTIEDSGDVYTVSPFLLNPEDVRFSEFPTSNINLILVHAALVNAGFTEKDVSIVTGLPVNNYFISGSARNTALIEKKRENLMRKVNVGGKGSANIIKNNVVSEAVAVFFDCALDFNGKFEKDYDDLKSSTVGVIDVGGKTTDCAVILPGAQAIDINRTNSGDIGVLTFYDMLKDELRMKHDVSMSLAAIERSVKGDRTVKLGGERIDINSIIDSKIQEFGNMILTGIQKNIGNGKELERIYIVGGGAHLLKDFLRNKYPHAIVPKNPEFSNARGMFKAAKYIYQ